MKMNYTQQIIRKVEELNPVHAKKLRKNFSIVDETYQNLSTSFYQKYVAILNEQGRTLDYAIDCYLNMIADINIEMVDFYRTGHYSSSSFSEVNQRVYSNPEVMEYYIHGIILSQFLWEQHYGLLTYFIECLPCYGQNVKQYLEVGAGHGLYISEAVKQLKNTLYTVVDVSNTSINLARKFVNNSEVKFINNDIFKFESSVKFDFITMGEVLEHVEEPLKLLRFLNELLDENGTLFITVPTNAPTIDHIYLFNSVDEIREMIGLAGFKIVSEKNIIAEDVSLEKAEKLKITILYGAFLKKKIN